MWQRGRAMSKRDWTLLRVAVVACVNDVYYGRLFFGDPDTQQVLWDTDVRPSDATFLALKVGAAAPAGARRSCVCVCDCVGGGVGCRAAVVMDVPGGGSSCLGCCWVAAVIQSAAS